MRSRQLHSKGTYPTSETSEGKKSIFNQKWMLYACQEKCTAIPKGGQILFLISLIMDSSQRIKTREND